MDELLFLDQYLMNVTTSVFWCLSPLPQSDIKGRILIAVNGFVPINPFKKICRVEVFTSFLHDMIVLCRMENYLVINVKKSRPTMSVIKTCIIISHHRCARVFDLSFCSELLWTGKDVIMITPNGHTEIPDSMRHYGNFHFSFVVITDFMNI